MADVDVRAIIPAEATAAAAPLARSHLDDPGMRAFFPEPRIRRKALDQVFGLTVRDAAPFGHVYAAVEDGRFLGTAAWLPPGAFPPSGLRRSLASAPPLLRIMRLSPRTVRAFVAFSMAAAKQAKGHRVWFLAGLGVDPRAQRGGVGGRLMAPVLDLADTRDEACWLNTQNEANLAYYQRFGFEVLTGPWRAGAGPQSWTMVRPAASGDHRNPN
ncbi:MAG: GNAT family N-acetyltransferase [Hamadaea sp.]|nr:GNAT family N-acetyltransferase [Hamadaea sp.]